MQCCYSHLVSKRVNIAMYLHCKYFNNFYKVIVKNPILSELREQTKFHAINILKLKFYQWFFLTFCFKYKINFYPVWSQWLCFMYFWCENMYSYFSYYYMCFLLWLFCWNEWLCFLFIFSLLLLLFLRIGGGI